MDKDQMATGRFKVPVFNDKSSWDLHKVQFEAAATLYCPAEQQLFQSNATNM